MRFADYLQNSAVHIMIYGEPFTGKSHLAATVCELGFRVIWISTDRGLEHLRLLSDEAKERLEIIYLPDSRDNPVAYTSTMGIFSGRYLSICHQHGAKNCRFCQQNNLGVTPVQLEKCGHDTVVVLDHLTQVSESAMNLAIRYSINKKEKDANNITWSMTDEDALVLYKPGYGQWQYLWNYMSELLNKIQMAPYHVVAISHVVETRQEDGERRLVPHGGSDRFSRTVPRYFDHIITTEVMNGRHVFSSATTDKTKLIAGSRTDISISKLTKEGERPSLAPFFNGEIPKDITREYGITAAEKMLDSGPGAMIELPPSSQSIAVRLAALKGNRI